MRKRASAASTALLFGSLWGLAEATAGHALHSLHVPGMAGFLMFPLGFFLMNSAYGRNRTLLSVLMTSWVAASVKLVDVLIPGADVMAVLNPAQAIVLQGLAAAGLIAFMKSIPEQSRPASFPAAAAATLGWRSAYAVLGLFWSMLTGAPNILQAGGAAILRFFVLDGLGNAVLIFLLMKREASSLYRQRVRAAPLRLHPALPLACLAAAMIAEAVL